MLSIFKLNTEEGLARYHALLIALDIKSPYYFPEYIEIFSGGLKNLICFSYFNKKNNIRVIMPVHLNPIKISDEKTYFFDANTPYGYSGPISSINALKSDIIEFWKNVDNWYLKNNVVSEFVRFNLSNNHLYYSGEVFQTMLNVKGKIIDEAEQWKSFNHKVRKNVNKAKKENLESSIYYINIADNKISEFFNIYTKTMVRTNADDKFYYSLNKFKRFIKGNEQNCAICTIYFDGTPISSELILISEDSIYSFLGGTDEKYFDKRPNDLLKVELINWARKKNIKYYVLGGGYGYEDGIFKYKKSFFPNDVVNFYTGRKIINKLIYNKLCEDLIDRIKFLDHPEADKIDESFFPLYRINFENILK